MNDVDAFAFWTEAKHIDFFRWRFDKSHAFYMGCGMSARTLIFIIIGFR